LDNIFAAKLGWLTGNQYSRIGTPDLEETEQNPNEYKKNFFDEALHSYTIWLTPRQARALRELVAKWKEEHPGQELSEETARGLAASVPPHMEFVAERAAYLLRERGIIPKEGDAFERAKTLLSNDSNLLKLIRSIPV